MVAGWSVVEDALSDVELGAGAGAALEPLPGPDESRAGIMARKIAERPSLPR